MAVNVIQKKENVHTIRGREIACYNEIYKVMFSHTIILEFLNAKGTYPTHGNDICLPTVGSTKSINIGASQTTHRYNNLCNHY